MLWIGAVILIGGIVWNSKGSSPSGKSGMSQANWLVVAGFCIISLSAYFNASDKCGRGDDMACLDLDEMLNPNTR